MRYQPPFPAVVPHPRARSHALLTRPPLRPKPSLDLHVLSLPPAFVLSQDQTLKLKGCSAHGPKTRPPRRRDRQTTAAPQGILSLTFEPLHIVTWPSGQDPFLSDAHRSPKRRRTLKQ